LPFGLDLVFLSGFFFILGNEVRQVTSEKTFDSLFIFLGTGIGLLVLNLLFTYEIDFNIRQYESFLVNTAEAILGILFILALSRQIELRSTRLASVFKYLGNISLIILLFHVPVQAFWGEKVMNVTDNFPLSILVGFIMGVLGPILIYELFIRFNPVASFWLGRQAESPVRKPELQEERTVTNTSSTPVVEIKEQ
jgi:peptidoglycan/LPS O-acetylase OafA/YrhL